MRDDHLEWIEFYRDSGYRIYYEYKTWVFKNVTCSKVWKEIVEYSTHDTFTVPSVRAIDRFFVTSVALKLDYWKNVVCFSGD